MSGDSNEKWGEGMDSENGARIDTGATDAPLDTDEVLNDIEEMPEEVIEEEAIEVEEPEGVEDGATMDVEQYAEGVRASAIMSEKGVSSGATAVVPENGVRIEQDAAFMKKTEKNFKVLYALVIIAMLALAGETGYLIYSNMNDTKNSSQQSSAGDKTNGDTSGGSNGSGSNSAGGAEGGNDDSEGVGGGSDDVSGSDTSDNGVSDDDVLGDVTAEDLKQDVGLFFGEDLAQVELISGNRKKIRVALEPDTEWLRRYSLTRPIAVTADLTFDSAVEKIYYVIFGQGIDGTAIIFLTRNGDLSYVPVYASLKVGRVLESGIPEVADVEGLERTDSMSGVGWDAITTSGQRIPLGGHMDFGWD